MQLISTLFSYVILNVLYLIVNNQEFHEAAKGVADKAVACGLEINLECGNYAIALKTSKNNTSKVIIRFYCID